MLRALPHPNHYSTKVVASRVWGSIGQKVISITTYFPTNTGFFNKPLSPPFTPRGYINGSSAPTSSVRWASTRGRSTSQYGRVPRFLMLPPRVFSMKVAQASRAGIRFGR